MKDINNASNELLLAYYENAADEAERLTIVIEMARRMNMMRAFTESLCKSAADRHATEVSIVATFLITEVPSYIPV